MNHPVSTPNKFPSLAESPSWHPRNFSVSMRFDLYIQEIFQSWWVSVSTFKKFLHLNESGSQHPKNVSVLMSLGLDIQRSCLVTVSTSIHNQSLLVACSQKKTQKGLQTNLKNSTKTNSFIRNRVFKSSLQLAILVLQTQILIGLALGPTAKVWAWAKAYH